MIEILEDFDKYIALVKEKIDDRVLEAKRKLYLSGGSVASVDEQAQISEWKIQRTEFRPSFEDFTLTITCQGVVRGVSLFSIPEKVEAFQLSTLQKAYYNPSWGPSAQMYINLDLAQEAARRLRIGRGEELLLNITIQ